MKQTPQQLFEQLSKEFGSKKAKEVINEELGKIVELKPLVQIESSVKEPFWTKFESFLAEGNSLEPIVNNDMKSNTKEGDEKIKADPKLEYKMDSKLAGSYKVSEEVQNIESHNYEYGTNVENINNVNAQEVLTGIQCEINYNSKLTLDEAKELAVKNLAKDPLHYVKEGQFGIKGLGYAESKQQQNDGKDYGGSGFSEKLKDGGDSMELVKESLGQIMTTGNPNSLAAMSGQVIKQMMAEKEETKLPMDEMEDEGTAVSYSDTSEAKGKDHDGDGDVDSDDYMAARDKAIKAAKAKKPKKESIDTKLAEIGKAGDITKMEAQLEFLNNHIDEKIQRVSSINEDDNLKELIDKSKMKAMQKEIKLLEKRKGKMEKMYEKMCGKKYRKAEMVDEMDAVSWNEKNNPTRSKAVGERDPKKVGQSTSAYAVNVNEVESINEIGANDMVVSYRDDEKIPIKFTGLEAFDGRGGKKPDTTRDDGSFVVTLDAERVDGEKLAGKEKFKVNIMYSGNKIGTDGTIPFPDYDRDGFKPEIVDFGNTFKYIKDNL